MNWILTVFVRTFLFLFLPTSTNIARIDYKGGFVPYVFTWTFSKKIRVNIQVCSRVCLFKAPITQQQQLTKIQLFFFQQETGSINIWWHISHYMTHSTINWLQQFSSFDPIFHFRSFPFGNFGWGFIFVVLARWSRLVSLFRLEQMSQFDQWLRENAINICIYKWTDEDTIQRPVNPRKLNRCKCEFPSFCSYLLHGSRGPCEVRHRNPRCNGRRDDYCTRGENRLPIFLFRQFRRKSHL